MRWRWLKSALFSGLREPVERHLKSDLTKAHSVTHSITPVEQVSVQRVLDRLTKASRPAGRVVGYAHQTGYYSDTESLAKWVVTDELVEAPVTRTNLASGPNETLDCVSTGLFLLNWNNSPIIVGVRPPRSYLDESTKLELIAGTRETAAGALCAILEEAKKASAYRGRCVLVEPGRYPERVSLRFHEIRATRREEIVLPESLLQIVERNVLGMLKHADALRSAGRSLRRGLLFHGAPGTGKTMVARYLVGACADHTVVLLNGVQQGLVTEACKIARMLAPSIVILEDVDVIAEDRERNRCPVVLHELMNEMDGLAPREEVTFLLTTNRPDVLEPALAARPGRIDQAIEFPLPDAECRRRLFDVYGRGLDLSAVDLDRWIAQTNGVSPAFIEEVLRKATLLAAERGEASRPMRLLDLDVQHAVKELVFFGGELTQKLLGYRTSRLGYHPDPA